MASYTSIISFWAESVTEVPFALFYLVDALRVFAQLCPTSPDGQLAQRLSRLATDFAVAPYHEDASASPVPSTAQYSFVHALHTVNFANDKIAHDKNTPLFCGFLTPRASIFSISPGRKKVSRGKPTEKWVVFIIDSSAILKRDVKKTPSLFNALLSVPTVGAAAFRLAQDIDYHGARRCQAKLCGARCGDGCGIA